MKTRSGKCFGKKPLSRDRQSIFGVYAEHDNIQTIGSNNLKRRALPENPKTEQSTQKTYRKYTCNIQTQLQMFSKNNLQPLRLANKDSAYNEQTRWIRQSVMRCYYRSTLQNKNKWIKNSGSSSVPISLIGRCARSWNSSKAFNIVRRQCSIA